MSVAALDIVSEVARIAVLHDEWEATARVHRHGWQLRRAIDRYQDARNELCERFAAQRGWQRTRAAFSLEQLRVGRPGRTRADDACVCAVNSEYLDLAEYYRMAARPYRPAAIVVHNYGRTHEECSRWAARQGLAFEPLPASWYYPGSTIAGIFLPGEGVA